MGIVAILDHNHFSNLSFPQPPKEAPYEIRAKLAQRLQKRSRLKMLTVYCIVLGFNNTSTLVGHFVSSTREREKRDRTNCRRDEREGQVRKTNKKESKETEDGRIDGQTHGRRTKSDHYS